MSHRRRTTGRVANPAADGARGLFARGADVNAPSFRRIDPDGPLVRAEPVEPGRADRFGEDGPEAAILPTDGVAANGKPIFDWFEAALQLTRSGHSWSSTLGQATSVTYGFRSSATSLPNGVSGFERFTEAQIIAAEAALALWADVANIVFTRVGSGTSGEAAYTNSATILFANYTSETSAAAGFAFLPSPGARGSTNSAGDIWIDFSETQNANPVFGDFGPHTLAHEIGHAIGLRHPGDYDAGSPTYAADAVYWQDARMFTVMSYFGSTNAGGVLPAFSWGPQFHDIAAAQRLYGANNATRTGDDVYGFNSTAGRSLFAINSAAQGAVFSIWDAGGNDTLDLSGYRENADIDLRPESFSSAGPTDDQGPARYNISIARGVIIENARGGSGSDTITGNAVANFLSGGAGADTLSGLDGDDTLAGGAGGDVLSGGDGIDTVDYSAAAGGLVIDAGNGAASTGEAQNDHLTTIERVIATNFSDTVRSWAGDLIVFGLGGDDTLIGGAAYDTFIGGPGGDFMDGAGGFDTVEYSYAAAGVTVDLAAPASNAGEAAGDSYANIERYVGSYFADVLRGSSGADILSGIGGDDTIDGAGGDDLLFGGTGADLFIGGPGYDTVEFSPATSALVIDWTTPANGTGEAAGDAFSGVERIIGSYFADRIIGSGASDNLFGLDGADTLEGGAGDDTLIGWYGSDVLDGGPGFDSVDYSYSPIGLRIDLVDPSASSGEAQGDSYIGVERIIASYRSDTLLGSAGNDILVGLDGADSIAGGVGDDLIFGGAGADTLDGGAGFDALSYSQSSAGLVVDLLQPAAGSGEAAGDVLSGFERIVGSYFGDAILGATAGEEIYGLAGDDLLRGRGGDDTLFGGAGADLFQFAQGEGDDVIADFADGVDLVDLRPYAGATFANTTIAPSGAADALVTLANGETVLLIGIAPAALSAADFLFA
jgi:serralysin